MDSLDETRERVNSSLEIEGWVTVAFVFMLALLPRLLVLFVVTDPQNPGQGWNTDVFHHWQIAYFSKEIGFSKGFLRLWDIKGMEYFWGLLHPLLITVLFHLTGTVDIIILRLLSSVAGSCSVVLVFYIMRRLFGNRVGIAAMFVALLNPVSIFFDASGMLGPLGIMFLLAGLWSYMNKRAAWAGILWAISAMVRAEYWLFGLGLVIAGLYQERDENVRFDLTAGWVAVIIVYMIFLFSKTGNPIYPVYWNFIGNVFGVWLKEDPLTSIQVIAVWANRALAILSAVFAYWVFKKHTPYRMLFLLCLGSVLFYGVFMGFTSFSNNFTLRSLVDRYTVLPYISLGIFSVALLLYGLPKVRPRWLWRSVGYLLFLLVLAASQLIWKTILNHYEPTRASWVATQEITADIIKDYIGGTICYPEDRPEITYALTRYHGVAAENLEGQMYDPFAYFEDDPFADWQSSRQEIKSWLISQDIQTLVFYTSKDHYLEMIGREPDWFEFAGTTQNGRLQIYSVLLASS